MNQFRLCVLFVISLVLPACQSISDNAPAAQTPSGVNVLAILARGGSWTNVGQVNMNEYRILPGGLPSGGFQLYFYAPYPAMIGISLDGVALPKFEDLPSGAVPGNTGFYRVVNINPNTSTPSWTVSVRPPNSLLTSLRYNIDITSISVNPKFRDTQGKNQVSPPLRIVAVAQLVNSLAISFPGGGRGNVSIHAEGDVNSTPTDQSCSADCVINFGNLYKITLKAYPSANSSFTNWSGNCTGSANTCNLHLNGGAQAASATFSASGSSVPVPSCPQVSPPAGYSYFNQPLCDGQNIYNDPAPALTCDASGYFCCAMSTGGNDPKCGSEHRSFPASCIGYGNPKVKMEPSGCYIQN